MARRIIVCERCEQERPVKALDMCNACYQAVRKGAPDERRINSLEARHAEMSATVKYLRDENRRMAADNARYREQIVALKIDLTRAIKPSKGRISGPVLSDMEIASTHLGELHDRLIGEARRTTSRAAATGLRLAAREVSKIRDRLSERRHLEEVTA